MSEIEFEGKTVEEAIEKGLKKLACSRENVEVKILNEGVNGLFGLMGNKPALVRIVTKGDVGKNIDYANVQKQAKIILENLLKHMGISYDQIDEALMAGRVMMNISSKESSLIIGKGGQTLDAIEMVLNLMLNRDPATRTKVSVDTDKFRQSHEDNLRKLARDMASKVQQGGEPYRFSPMPSRDRRVIHEYLKTDDNVETVSENEGMFRRICIKPKAKAE